MAKKVLIIASVASMIDQFNIPNIMLLQSLGYAVDVATNFEKGSTCTPEKIAELKQKLLGMQVGMFQIDFDRNIANVKAILKAARQLDAIMDGYAFVHCHSPIGGIIGRLSAKRHGIKTIYTAHGFHFYKGAPLKNWLLYYPFEWFFSWLTDVLITINKEDYERARKHLHAKELHYVPGVGIDVHKFGSANFNRNEKRLELGITEDDILLLSVGELSGRKNHRAVINVLGKIKNPKIHYAICGRGILEEELRALAEKNAVSLHLLGFRNDIGEICRAADLFVFPSLQEGLPVALMEAIACRVPVVCSRIRGNTDLVTDDAYLFSDEAELQAALTNALLTDNAEAVAENFERLQLFAIDTVNASIEAIYKESIQWGGVIYRLLYRHKLLSQWNVSPNSFLILSVGELNGNKNHRGIIEALGALVAENPERYRQIHYAVAGKGVLHDALLECAEKNGVKNQVHLLGFRTDVADLLRAADVFALPSKREGLNVSLMEAIASGTYCLASDIRGNCDLVTDEAIGRLIKSPDARAWADGIAFAWERKNTHLNGERRNAVIQMISSENIEEKMKAIYTDIS